MLVTQSCLTLQPHEWQPVRLLCPWGYPSKNTGVGCHFLLQGNLPDPGIEPASPALAGGFFPTESPGKPIQLLLLKWNPGTAKIIHNHSRIGMQRSDLYYPLIYLEKFNPKRIMKMQPISCFILFLSNIKQLHQFPGASLVTQMVKNLPAVQETWV